MKISHLNLYHRSIFLFFFMAMQCVVLAEKMITPMPPVTLNGKPFFPVGCYDMVMNGAPDGQLVDPGFLAAGGNIAIIGSIGLPGHPFYKDFRQPVLFKALEKMSSNADCKNIAMIVGLDFPLIYEEVMLDGRKRYAPLDEKTIKERTAFLTDDLKKLRSYSNIIGYYLDEPENALYHYYEKNHHDLWATKKDYGLAEKVTEWSRWLNQLIRKEHPEAKLIPGLAWWTVYDSCPEMYDINAPAHYPAGVENLAEVCYDATLAVNAARRAGGGRTVIYSPAMFDKMDSGWKYSIMTREQERYVCFAPITRGAMGIWGWRLKRCTEKYRDEIVYPTMHEISELSHFFLGEWHDHLVTSDHDSSTKPYLQTFKERIRLVSDEEDAKNVTVRDAVPDVCHCLRRDHKTGEYLLLLVSNMRTEEKVTFTFTDVKLPPVLVNFFDKTHVLTKGNSFTVTLSPFDTRAYCFSVK